MQALYNLVHSLAKEEKRLYNLHGRKSRFTQIYKGYLNANEYNKQLDRQLYQKHFSSFSKAFYSMQKNALMDDILAVLLEYSNSSKDDFVINRYKAKYEVLNYRGFHGQALNYIRAALDACEKIKSPRLRLRILEDYRDTLAQSDTATWEEYAEIISRIESTSEMVAKNAPFEENRKKLKVLAQSNGLNPEDSEEYKSISQEILESIQTIAEQRDEPAITEGVFESEVLFSKTFEDKFALHKRLVLLEKQSNKEHFPKDIRLQIINLLMESALECGDFLLINGLIYKTNKSNGDLNPAQRATFLPKYLELCALYHFYENDLPLAQQELRQLLDLSDLSHEQRVRYYLHKIGVLIAANLPRSASQTLEELLGEASSLKHEISVKLIELIITIEMNQREEALVRLQRLRAQIRKSKDARKLGHIRQFLEMVQKMLDKKRITYQEIAALNTDWMDILKLNLWLKAKIENNFYYNYILDYWQTRKKILNV
ncbi:MAG: hypothetical protein AAGN35_05340 [Bacteroidota bacterium]